jgi:hypothetical protein
MGERQKVKLKRLLPYLTTGVQIVEARKPKSKRQSSLRRVASDYRWRVSYGSPYPGSPKQWGARENGGTHLTKRLSLHGPFLPRRDEGDKAPVVGTQVPRLPTDQKHIWINRSRIEGFSRSVARPLRLQSIRFLGSPVILDTGLLLAAISNS